MEKVYLETPEAVIKALKEGKKIEDEDGHSYKLVEGFIVYTDGNKFFVGDNVGSIYNPYILEKKPFKIEIGKWYETRNHEKARCYLFDGHNWFFTIDNYTSFSTNRHGYHMEEEAHDLDIIGPWKEKL